MVRVANLKHSFNSLPCGTRLSLGKKFKENGQDCYEAYTSIKQTKESYAGTFPKALLQLM